MKCFRFICILTVFLGISTWVQGQNASCTGSEYTTNSEFFRAAATAQSSDATASKKKAAISARNAMTSQIKAKAEMAAKSQSKFGSSETEAFLELVEMAIQQEVAHLKVICEDSRQTAGRYKTNVVVELPKASVLRSIIGLAKSDDKLKGLFEEGKFKEEF